MTRIPAPMAGAGRARGGFAAAACLAAVAGGGQAAIAAPADARAGLVEVDLDSDIRYATRRNFTGRALPGYCEPKPLLLRSAARRLLAAHAELGRTSGLGLKVFDAYRPVQATRAMVRWAERTGNRRLLDGGYIARRSNHNLGTTVDLTLVDVSREGHPELDMGTRFDAFTPRSATLDATGTVLRNRLILKRAMEGHGFRNYAREWWHYDSRRPGPRPLDVPIGVSPRRSAGPRPPAGCRTAAPPRPPPPVRESGT